MSFDYFLSTVLRGKWLLKPGYAISQQVILSQILQREFSAWSELPEKKSFADSIILLKPNAEKTVGMQDQEEDKESAVGVIPVKGSLLKYGTRCTYGTEEIAMAAREIASDDRVGAMVFDIDSPGGAVDAVAPIIDAMNYIKKILDKPIVAKVDLAASAGYWMASQADMIIADNDISSEVGSIGVMMSFFDVIPYYEDLKIKYHEIYGEDSEQYKNKTFRLALEGKYDQIKEEELNPLEKRFQEAVKIVRPNLNLKEKGIIHGRTFFARQALNLGLIDDIGNLDYVANVAMGLLYERRQGTDALQRVSNLQRVS